MGLTRSLAIAAWLGLLLPSTATGQGIVEAASLSADVRADGSASVGLTYQLSDGAAVADLTVELLGFADATAEDVVVDGGGRIVLWPASGSRRSATLSLPLAEPGAARTVTFDYGVSAAVTEDAGAVTVHIPIISLSLPPATETGDVFRASISVPEAWEIADGFPSGLSERSPGVHEVDLSVVPAVVTLRGRTDGRRVVGLGRVVDLLTAVILLGFGFIGWRHLRGIAA